MKKQEPLFKKLNHLPPPPPNNNQGQPVSKIVKEYVKRCGGGSNNSSSSRSVELSVHPTEVEVVPATHSVSSSSNSTSSEIRGGENGREGGGDYEPDFHSSSTPALINDTIQRVMGYLSDYGGKAAKEMER